MEELIKDIAAKKELASLSKETIKEFLETYFKQEPKIQKKLEDKKYNKKSEEYKIALKEVRRKLREIYGVFVKDKKRRDKLLLNINKENQKETIQEILKLHTSTEERLRHYDEVYEQIFAITGKVDRIIDLACGLNPVSYFKLGIKPSYFASDMSKEDMNFLEAFFRKTSVNGTAEKIDLVSEVEKVNDLKGDVCFLFKALDSLETRKRNISRQIIESVNCKWIVVSFPKTSLGGGKTISKNKRNWFLNYLKYTDFGVTEFETENEFFLVIEKKTKK